MQNDALIRFYYKKEPEKLTDNEWTKLSTELIFVLKFNGTLQENKETK